MLKTPSAAKSPDHGIAERVQRATPKSKMEVVVKTLREASGNSEAKEKFLLGFVDTLEQEVKALKNSKRSSLANFLYSSTLGKPRYEREKASKRQQIQALRTLLQSTRQEHQQIKDVVGNAEGLLAEQADFENLLK